MKHRFRWRVVILHPKSNDMDTSFIIAVALGVAIVVVMLALVAVIVFQRWRISDNNAHLKEFIDENMELRRKMHRYERITTI